MKSFTLPKKDVKIFLDYLKIYAFKEYGRLFMQSISLWQIDGVNYVCATDGRSVLMMDAPNLGIKITKEMSQKCFNMIDVKGNQDILFEVTEDNISMFIGDNELKPMNNAVFPAVDRVLPGGSSFRKVNEVTLWGDGLGYRDPLFYALLNGSEVGGINIVYLNFMFKNFKNIEYCPNEKHPDDGAYEFRNDSFRMICMPVRHEGKLLTLGEFKNHAAEYYLNNIDAKKHPVSEYLLSLVTFPDETAEYKVQSHIICPDWIVSYLGKMAIFNSEDNVIQPIDVKYRGNGGYKLEFGLKPGELVLEFDINMDLTVLQSGKKYNGSIDYRQAPHFPDLDKTAKNKLGKVYAYEREDRKGRLEYFELNGMLYPLWKLLYLSSNKDLRYGYVGSDDYLIVTDGHVFIFFDEYIPLAHKDKQISLRNDIAASHLVRNGLSSYFSVDYVMKFLEGIIETPDRDSVTGDGMAFSKGFSAEEIVDWNDEYQYAMEVTEQIGKDLVQEFTNSGEIKKIVDSIDVNISNILRDYASKIDKSIDSKGLDFVANKIISKIGFKGDKKDLLIIMQACGIDEAYIMKIVHEHVRNILSKNYGDF